MKGCFAMKKIRQSGLVGLLFVVVLAVALCAGCGGSKTASTGTTSSPSSALTTPLSPKTPGTSPVQGSTPATSSNTLPRYMPSSVVSDTPGSLQLTSPDSVQKVTAFYDDALKTGWSIISSSKTAASTNITARKGTTGTTLSVSSTGSGTYISLVTYPI
jgi:hypothetical protein